jgi:hypothetical protein
MKQHKLIGLGLLAASVLMGCASKPETAKTEEPKQEAKQAAKPEEEYVRQSSVGSWIPKKVKKSEAVTSEAETNAAKKSLDNMQQRGATAARGSGD